jgi:uncharacterized protein YkuJ
MKKIHLIGNHNIVSVKNEVGETVVEQRGFDKNGNPFVKVTKSKPKQKFKKDKPKKK